MKQDENKNKNKLKLTKPFKELIPALANILILTLFVAFACTRVGESTYPVDLIIVAFVIICLGYFTSVADYIYKAKYLKSKAVMLILFLELICSFIAAAVSGGIGFITILLYQVFTGLAVISLLISVPYDIIIARKRRENKIPPPVRFKEDITFSKFLDYAICGAFILVIIFAFIK